jgi:hypothetical protein
MPSKPTAGEILATILRLSLEERELILNALQESLVDDSLDHGPAEPADDVQAAWDDEIARRIADVDSGRVKTIPADDAERLIRGKVRPDV